jgi:tyrosinase
MKRRATTNRGSAQRKRISIHDLTFGDLQPMVTVDPTGPPVISAAGWDNMKKIFSKPRKNQKYLTSAEKDDFNFAIESAIDDEVYQNHANIHHQVMYTVHGGCDDCEPVGKFRFLPWHRVYVYKLELLLHAYVPGLRIPFWDFATDYDLPSWVTKPEGVIRGTDPVQVTNEASIEQIISTSTSYEAFTEQLELVHNQVHIKSGGTLNSLHFSPKDPIFWLLHSNVDRIWARRQKLHPDELPSSANTGVITGADATMDPWPDDINDTRSTYNYYYFYYIGFPFHL